MSRRFYFTNDNGDNVASDYDGNIRGADVQPVKRGKWILIDDDTVHGKCSECGFECHYYEDDVFGMPFCPNCGAVMSTDE